MRVRVYLPLRTRFLRKTNWFEVQLKEYICVTDWFELEWPNTSPGPTGRSSVTRANRLLSVGGGASVEGDQHLFPGTQLPAYISSMGVVGAARRRGVASALLEGAREAAADLGAAGLFVVTMAVNERARALYASLGFEVVKEESVNLAARRGGCLDGQDGKARTVLLVDPAFRPKE